MDIFSKEIAKSLNLLPTRAISTTLTGNFTLRSIYCVSELAIATVEAAGRELALLTGAKHILLNRRLTESWFKLTVNAKGWSLPEAWDPVAGNYEARDGWIRLHTNVPAHLRAALRVLRVERRREAVATAAISEKARTGYPLRHSFLWPARLVFSHRGAFIRCPKRMMNPRRWQLFVKRPIGGLPIELYFHLKWTDTARFGAIQRRPFALRYPSGHILLSTVSS